MAYIDESDIGLNQCTVCLHVLQVGITSMLPHEHMAAGAVQCNFSNFHGENAHILDTFI